MNENNFLQLWTSIRAGFDEIFEKYDNLWQIRDREIDSRFLALFIFRLVIPHDNRGYSCTLSEILANFLNSGLGVSKKKLAKSSICEARQKLDPSMFMELNRKIIEQWNQYTEPFLWHGHRTLGIDGSKFTLPKQLLAEGYIKSGDHAYYPQGLVSILYDLSTGIPMDFDMVKHNNERACAVKHMQTIEKGDIIVHDRGYFSFELLARYVQIGAHPVFRMQKSFGWQVMEEFWNSKETDKIVLLDPPRDILKEVKNKTKDIPLDPIKIRFIKYEIQGITYVLSTTLLDKEKYPVDIFPDLYHSRWGIEEMIKVSKLITGVEDFHSKSEKGVKQELFAHFTLITIQKIFETESHRKLMKDKKEKVEKPPLRRIVKSNMIDSKKSQQPKSSQLTLESEKSTIESKTNKEIELPHDDLREKVTNNEIKMNQKNAFIVLGGVLEKLLFFSIDSLSSIVTYLVDEVKSVYQKIRPGRSYPRESKKPASDWSHRGKDKKWMNKQCLNP
jgi:hypothetical protein